MANKKVNKIVKNNKPMKPAKKANKIVKPQNKTTTKKQKQVKVQKIKINSFPKTEFKTINFAVVTEAKNTYKFGKWEVKKSYFWIGVAVIVLLCIIL